MNGGVAENMKLAVKLHNTWCRLTRTAVGVWCCIAIRCGIPRDIRRLIGEIVWASRRDALYDLDATDKTIVYRQGTRHSTRKRSKLSRTNNKK